MLVTLTTFWPVRRWMKSRRHGIYCIHVGRLYLWLTVAILTSIVHQTDCIHIDKHDRRQSGIDTAQVCVLKQAHAL